jgi:hypothetical protein
MSILSFGDPAQTALNAHNAMVAWNQAHAAAAAAGRQPAPAIGWVQNASQLLADSPEELTQKIQGAPYAYQYSPTGWR